MKRFAVSEHDHEAPEIKAGKRYEVLDWEQEGDDIAFFNINTTSYRGPFKANCLAFCSCAFLEGEFWTIIEEEEPTKEEGLKDG